MLGWSPAAPPNLEGAAALTGSLLSESILAEREMALVLREAELTRREAALCRAEEAAVRRARELETAVDAVEAQRERLEEVRREYETRRDALVERTREVEAERNRLRDEQAQLVCVSLELEQRERAVDLEIRRPVPESVARPENAAPSAATPPQPCEPGSDTDWWAKQLGSPLEAA